MKTTSKMKRASKIKTTTKMKMTSIFVPPKKKKKKNLFALVPPIILPEFFSHFYIHTATEVNPDILSGYRTGSKIPHDLYNICGIARVYTYRKDSIFMLRRLVKSFTCVRE